MIYVPLQDLHLVHSMDWISELSRRYHSVRIHILTFMARFFLLALLVTSLLIGGKAEGLTLPSFLFCFCSLRLASWVLGCVGFPCEQKRDRGMTFGKPTKEEANKSISVNQKWQSSRGLVKLLSLFVDVMQVRRWSL